MLMLLIDRLYPCRCISRVSLTSVHWETLSAATTAKIW